MFGRCVVLCLHYEIVNSKLKIRKELLFTSSCRFLVSLEFVIIISQSQ